MEEDDDVRHERKRTESVVATRVEAADQGREALPPKPIEAVSLRKVYKNGKAAVHNLTFSVDEDEVFGLLGPNGPWFHRAL